MTLATPHHAPRSKARRLPAFAAVWGLAWLAFGVEACRTEHCTGEPTCIADKQSSCEKKPGCNWGPRCSSVDCSVVGDGPTCEGLSACVWSEDTCRPRRIVLCEAPETQAACEATPGCFWQDQYEPVRCVALESTCGSASEADCSTNADCQWIAQCSGTPKSCGAYHDEDACNIHPPCGWTHEPAW